MRSFPPAPASRSRRLAAGLLAAAVLYGCIDAARPLLPDARLAQAPSGSTVVIVKNGSQVAPPGSPLQDLVIELRRSDGSLLGGVDVQWRVVAGGGSVHGRSRTQSNGRARGSWTLGSGPGEQRVEVHVPGAGTVVFRARAVAGAHLVVMEGDGQAAPVGSDTLSAFLIVQLRDGNGDPLAGVPIEWGVAHGGGGLRTGETETDGEGKAGNRWLLGPIVGEQYVGVRLVGTPGATFSATAPQAGATIRVVKHDSQSGFPGEPLELPLVAAATGPDGQPLPGSVVHWEILSGGGTIQPLKRLTQGNGRSLAIWVLGGNGEEQQVQARIAGVERTAIFTAQVIERPRIVVLSGDGQGAPLGADTLPEEIVVQARDSGGRPLPGVVVLWAVDSGGGGLRLSQGTTDANGKVTNRWVLGNQVGEQRISALHPGMGPETIRATATAGGATVRIERGEGEARGWVAAQVVSGTGKPLQDVRVGWTVLSGEGWVRDNLQVTGEGGTALTYWTGRLEGEQGLRASVAGLPPVTVDGWWQPLRPHSITTGVQHACGLDVDGRAYCWGDGSYGLLGTGTLIDSHVPVAVAGGHQFVHISAGAFHTVALTAEGETYAWGWNNSGRLGDGTTETRLAPVRIAGGHRFTRISVGDDHTVAITEAGDAYAWGGNWTGQLGDGTHTPRYVPVPVSGGHRFTEISAGANFTLALAVDSTAHAWGSNHRGTLGNGSTTLSTTPVPVTGSRKYRQISAGSSHALALTPEGTAFAWGFNDAGQLGEGTNRSRTSPVEVFGGHVFTRVSAGAWNSFALTHNGVAYGWGRNDSGELGDETTVNRRIPVRIAIGHRFQDLSAGHGFLLALSSDGAYAWGYNANGQLGDGTTLRSTTPVKVLSGRWTR